MIEIGVSLRYRLGSILSTALLILSWFYAGSAYAQPRCEQAKERIYRIIETQARQVPDSLQTALNLIAFVRDCESDMSSELDFWLLNNEVFTLDKLERYEEAKASVGRFFDTYFDEASDYHRARFYLWRLHLRALSGNGVGMVGDYLEARQYADVLEPSRRAHLHINGAHAYQGLREYRVALELTQEAKTLLATPQTYEDSLALARAFHMEAELQLLRRVDLPQVLEAFRQIAGFYGALGDTSRVATATTLLGETYAANGDTSQALAEMEAGVQLARQSSSARSEVYALFRQGQLLRRWGDLKAAEQILVQASDASEIVQEFTLRIAYELAMLYEERNHLDRAVRYYQAVIDAPKPGDLVAALEAEIKQQRAQSRLLLIENGRNERRFYFALSALFIVLSGGLVLFVVLQRRTPTPKEPTGLSIALQKSNGDFVPRKLPTGLTLDELEERFREMVKSTKLGKRLAWIYAVLLDIELVLRYITDEYLARKMKTYSIAHNAELFKCVAAIEEARTGETFTGHAENTLGAHLRGEFDKRGWHYPKHQVIWKQHFMKHHVERLFKPKDDIDEGPDAAMDE